uniref:Uncharacterized protein n=1 Tax=Chlorella vulgaris TaxID=3077 RepID=V9H185_CHLVU|nr:hypothetical protein ChvulCp163 [Chlorella vulgaris]pir/T07349/ hypothetical protein 63 - Chlorella vulgaris chloroplast [Chlorella vulgaris]BAA57997.1 unnamed protein product [Chlorella vulgaris]
MTSKEKKGLKKIFFSNLSFLIPFFFFFFLLLFFFIKKRSKRIRSFFKEKLIESKNESRFKAVF